MKEKVMVMAFGRLVAALWDKGVGIGRACVYVFVGVVTTSLTGAVLCIYWGNGCEAIIPFLVIPIGFLPITAFWYDPVAAVGLGWTREDARAAYRQFGLVCGLVMGLVLLLYFASAGRDLILDPGTMAVCSVMAAWSLCYILYGFGSSGSAVAKIAIVALVVSLGLVRAGAILRKPTTPPAPPAPVGATTPTTPTAPATVSIWMIQVGKAKPYPIRHSAGFDGSGSELTGEWVHNGSVYTFSAARDGSWGEWWTLARKDGTAPTPTMKENFIVKKTPGEDYAGLLDNGKLTFTVRIFERKL